MLTAAATRLNRRARVGRCELAITRLDFMCTCTCVHTLIHSDRLKSTIVACYRGDTVCQLAGSSAVYYNIC